MKKLRKFLCLSLICTAVSFGTIVTVFGDMAPLIPIALSSPIITNIEEHVIVPEIQENDVTVADEDE